MPGRIFSCAMWDLQPSLRYVGSNSLTRDRTQPPALGMQSLSHWTIKVPTAKCITLQSEIRSLKWLSLGWNQGVGKAAFLSKALGGKCTFLPFPALRGHPHSLAPAPCIFKATILPNETSFLYCITQTLILLHAPSLTMSLVVTLGSPG